jgi:hypothetical protein
MANDKAPETFIPGMEQLEATPEVLRVLMAPITIEDALWKPAPDRFSVAEVLEHLSHIEGHCYRLRVERAVERDGAEWQDYDTTAWASAGQYSGRDPEDSFAHWEEQREDNLEYLKGLPPGAEARHGIHPVHGRITVSELVAAWAFHDLGHVRQIAELIRARRYYPRIGPYQREYRG